MSDTITTADTFPEAAGIALHGGYDTAANRDSITVPVYPSAAYDLQDFDRSARIIAGTEAGAHLYTRVANPTTDVLEARLAALDGGKTAVVFGSGMAAVSSAILTLADTGGRIIASRNIYGATFDFIDHQLSALGVGVDYVDDVNDTAAIEAAIGPDTRLVFTESVSNPNGHLADIPAISNVAHAHGIAVVVDNTLPTAYVYRPIAHGADVVVYSTTKAINGHGNAIGGAVVDAGRLDYSDAARFPQLNSFEHNVSDEEHGVRRSFVEAAGRGAFAARLRNKYLRLFGAAAGPFESYLTLIGLETLAVRLDREIASATIIANWLAAHSHVKEVRWAPLAGHTDHALYERDYAGGVGAVLSFTLEGGDREAKAFIDATRVFTYATNIGDSKSLITNPARTTHREFDPVSKEQAGITPDLIRLSVGLEDAYELIDDLERGFTAAYGE